MRYYLIVATDVLDNKLQPEINGKPNKDFDENLYKKAVEAQKYFRYGTLLGGSAGHRLNIAKKGRKRKAMIEVDFTKRDENGDVDEAYIKELVNAGLILDYFHYPHLGDGRNACIHCYIGMNRDEWEENVESVNPNE